MTEILLLLVIVALLVYLAWDRFMQKKERDKLINALISKNAQEARDLELAQNTKLDATTTNPAASNYVDTSDLTDEQMSDLIQKELDSYATE